MMRACLEQGARELEPSSRNSPPWQKTTCSIITINRTRFFHWRVVSRLFVARSFYFKMDYKRTRIHVQAPLIRVTCTHRNTTAPLLWKMVTRAWEESVCVLKAFSYILVTRERPARARSNFCWEWNWFVCLRRGVPHSSSPLMLRG